jgi:predicted lipid-binding transport protein (Tim44 family)
LVGAFAFAFAFARAFEGIVGRFVGGLAGGLIVPLLGPLEGAFIALVGAFLLILSSKKVIGFGKRLDLRSDESAIVDYSIFLVGSSIFWALKNAKVLG